MKRQAENFHVVVLIFCNIRFQALNSYNVKKFSHGLPYKELVNFPPSPS